MELNPELRQNLLQQQQHPMMLSENYAKARDGFPFETQVTFSKGNSYLQDFQHLDQFHVQGGSASSSNPVFGIPNAFYDPFEPVSYGCSTNCFNEMLEKKPFGDSYNRGNAHAVDNFQRNDLNTFDFQETGAMNFVVSDEFSSVGGWSDKKAGFSKSRTLGATLPSSSRNLKGRRKSNLVKGQWTVEEDKLLIQLVDQYGLRKWSHIAQMLPGRIGKQCRERWHNHLRPDIKKDTWSEEEDKVLIQAHGEIGNKWAEIAKRLPGRTENSIKNHWNATKRRQFSKRKCRSKYPRGSLLQEYIKSLNLDSATTPRNRQDKTTPSPATGRTSNLQTQQGLVFCPDDRLVPEYDFNDVPDFSFDEKLFQDQECSIDSLLDDIHSAPVDKTFEMDMTMMEPGMVKKELDLVEMISQTNL
ncbi:hypothetical protein SLEP1_g29256 [Rubroshorea leprosula]|uniref:Uncharacterized protein n=1 Tax=Rubroshorea leprosula TaxID=152421 RepID=A0AAV5K752_9ROSI|nr:hypothetical protein SLEP1_g29256 [Rubroshorea leprosula]